MKQFRAIDLWELLNHRNGLHLRNQSGRDNQLYNELKKNLCCPEDVGIKKFLRSNTQIAGLQFIQAFLKVTEPFSNMYRDIFALMKKYSAKKVNESVKIRCELRNEELEFDLDHFKELIRVESLVRQVIQRRVWEPNFIYEIIHFFRILTNNSIVIDAYQESNDILLPPPTYNHPKLNEYLFEVYNLFSNIKNHHIGNTNWYVPYTRAKPFYDEFVLHGKPPNIEEAINEYEKIFSKLESQHVEVEVIMENFEQYLNLPFWKNRWYVYEVWITLQTVAALSDYNIELNVGSNGILPLSSGRYSHVATFLDENDQEYTLHAQFQTTVEGFENRKGMEPDLRIIVGHNLKSEFTKIIIECKQRIAMKKQQLEKNIELYEYGAINSQNLFVNYDLFPKISNLKRTQLLSNVRPNNTDEFFQVFNEVLLNSNIIPKVHKTKYCTVLIDSSGSMNSTLTSEVKNELLNILKNLEVKNYYYFNSDLIETIYDTPEALLENILPTGNTNLNTALRTLLNKYPDKETVFVITDQESTSYTPDVKEHFIIIQELNITNL